jgi:alkylhydroperoxidase family enzyme
MTIDDLRPLREVGMDELEIFDLTNAAAMFANANRLMQTLGEPVVPETQS